MGIRAFVGSAQQSAVPHRTRRLKSGNAWPMRLSELQALTPKLRLGSPSATALPTSLYSAPWPGMRRQTPATSIYSLTCLQAPACLSTRSSNRTWKHSSSTTSISSVVETSSQTCASVSKQTRYPWHGPLAIKGAWNDILVVIDRALGIPHFKLRRIRADRLFTRRLDPMPRGDGRSRQKQSALNFEINRSTCLGAEWQACEIF